MVVIGAAFLGILGALILSITYTNINLKTANYKSKQNFYREEIAVNEITAKLEEYSAKSMSVAQTWFIKNYAGRRFDMEACNKEYRKQYMIALSQMLHGTPDVSVDVADSYHIDKLKSGILSFETDETKQEHVAVKVNQPAGASEGVIEHSKDKFGNLTYDSLTLKDISITYQEANGYNTKIVTDITMEFPIPNAVDTTFAKFALISDQLIDCSSVVTVTGGVYAGETEPNLAGVGNKVNPDIGGILVRNTTGNLTIDGNSNLIATRGNITAHNYGKLKITNAKVWAKNIRTFGAGDSTGFTPRIELDAVTKVQDDLIMKAPNSTITLKNSYYGFSYKSKDATGKRTTSNTSSAFTINAKNIGLDMSGLKNLVLYGRAFISSSDTGDAHAGSSTLMDIMTGQSIGVKYDQAAYLVPNKSFLKIPINPIDQTTIQAYAANLHAHDSGYDPIAPHLSLDMKHDIVDFSKGDASAIRPFLDDTMPIRPIYYKQGAQTTDVQMVNFYWNFKDEESANRYFEWYFAHHGSELVDTFKDFYRLDGGKYNLKFNLSSFHRMEVAGDFLYQDQADGSFHIQKSNVADMEEESIQLANTYQSVQLNLREDGSTAKEVKENEYVDTHFKLAGVRSNPIRIDHIGIQSTRFHEDASIIITNEEKFHVEPGMNGLIIASGDVVVDAVRFEGLIVADGKIELSTNASIYADEKMILDLLKYCQNNGNVMKKYIYGYDSSSKADHGDDRIHYADAIVFENWKKSA